MFQAILSILGRLFLVAIFMMSAVGNKIPQFNQVAGVMADKGVPYPQIALGGAIAFLLIGGLLVLLGYHARFGAGLLMIFLALATYYFHNPSLETDPQAQQNQIIQCLKNLSIAGGMLFIMANGSGAGSMKKRRSA